MENSFHGRTFGSLATTGQEKYRKPFAPLMPGVEFVRFNDVADLKKKFDSSVCAIALEILQGEGGIQPVTNEFLKTARKLTKSTGALLLADEIQSGLGRTGRYFAYQQYGVTPDVVTVAKPLAAGIPLGAILTTEAVASAVHPGMHGTTFGGGPLACAVALEFLATIKRDHLLEHIQKVGFYFLQQLRKLQKQYSCITDVRGIGLMLAAELDSADLAKAVVSTMLAKGLIINRTHDKVLRFLPPYVIEKRHVDQLIQGLKSVLNEKTSAAASATGSENQAQKRRAKK
jgi:acetylornithine aminotransferase/acetylornithine/N-succinyldiaminopimelate aminotransferase